MKGFLLDEKSGHEPASLQKRHGVLEGLSGSYIRMRFAFFFSGTSCWALFGFGPESYTGGNLAFRFGNLGGWLKPSR